MVSWVCCGLVEEHPSTASRWFLLLPSAYLYLLSLHLLERTLGSCSVECFPSGSTGMTCL